MVASFILPIINSPAHALAVSPSDWQAGRIIDDTVFMNKDAMSVNQIQQFLNSKVPSCDTYGDVGGGYRKTRYPNNPPPFTCLKDYKEVPKTTPGNWIPESNYGRTDGWAPAGSKSAAELIWDAAQAYRISPKVLLVNLQKESSLIVDDWPLKSDFTYAMGAECPDSGPGGTANCNVNYSGFSLQIRHSAELYRAYIDNMSEPWWTNKRPFQNNYIQYNPDVNCGGSQIYMSSRATTALYVYTPYQPNQASLNAGYGSAGVCGAYGVRNFWLFYNNWFGTALDTSFILAKSSASSQQYVIYNNLKQSVPSPEVKIAWGLDTTPMQTVDQAYIDSLVTGPDLDVVFRVNSGLQLYVVDNGKRYYIQSPDMLRAWKLDGKAISNVPTGLGLTPADGGILTYAVRKSGASEIYMVDGLDGAGNTILRRYDNPDVLFGIEGTQITITTVSDGRFSTINRSIKPDLISTKATFGGNEYQLVSGQRLPETYTVASLYPGVATQISDITFNRLVPSSPVTPYVTAPGNPKVYLVQGGAKYHITSPAVLREWAGSASNVLVVNQAFENLLADGGVVSTTVTQNGQSLFVLQDGYKNQVSSQLLAAYASPSTFSAAQSLLDVTPTRQKTITQFVRDNQTGQIFLLDNSSILHLAPTVPVAQLWGMNSANIVNLPHETIAGYSVGAVLRPIVSDGVTTYAVINGGLKDTTTNAAQWRLSSPLVIADGTLALFPHTGDLQVTAASGGKYYRLINGTPFMTTDRKIARSWGITDSAEDYGLLIEQYYPSPVMLTPSFQSGGNYYVADQTKLYKLSTALYQNLNIPYPAMSINAAIVSLPQQEWVQPIFRNTQGGWMVIDNGSLRTFNNSTILSHWLANFVQPEIVASENFISMFRMSSPIERAIKSTASPSIYSAEGATKRWITSSSLYNSSYAPYTIVSNQLLDAMPNGNNL